MIWIYPEQLSLELKKKLKSIYILFGNDLGLLQDTQLDVLKTINKLYCADYLNIELDIHFNWNKIFNLCKTTTLFSKLKILSLKFPWDYPITSFSKNTPLLSSLINTNLVLILLIYTSHQPKQHSVWMKFFNKIAVFVNCITPEHMRLEIWIKNQSKNMKLIIENLACQLLCYYYEGNTILLKQTLNYLSLIYPDGNLSFLRVKNIITDSACFNYNHWIEAILIGKKQRANRILKQLEHMDFNLKTLLYKIQQEISVILQIKYSMKNDQSLYILFKEHKIHTQYHRVILSKAIRRLSLNQLYKAISLLVQMELEYYQNYMCLSRSNFELLTEILCCDNKNFSICDIIINNNI